MKLIFSQDYCFIYIQSLLRCLLEEFTRFVFIFLTDSITLSMSKLLNSRRR